MRKSLIGLFSIAALAMLAARPSSAWAYAKDCPVAVNTSVDHVHHAAKVTYCFEHRFPTGSIFEVKITTADGHHLELHTKADGTVIADKEKLSAAAVPKNIVTAFETRYPRLHVKMGWRNTVAGAPTKYEVLYSDEGGRHYATFNEDGSFVSQSDDLDSER